MSKNVYVLFVLDRSGSMEKTKNETIQGFNEHVQQAKDDAKDLNIFASLITFSGEVYEHYWNIEVSKIEELTDKTYLPLGSTALRDGVGYGLRKLAQTTDVDDKNNKYLVIIISDGNENASKHIEPAELKELIESYKKTDRWTFTYMGCDDKAIDDVAKEMAIPFGNIAKWSNNTGSAVRVANAHGRSSLGRYFSDVKSGVGAKATFYSEDASQIADFTEANVNKAYIASQIPLKPKEMKS